MEQESKWSKLRELDFLGGLGLRGARRREVEGIKARNFAREQQYNEYQQKLLLQNITATNQLEQIRATGGAQTEAKRIEEERLRELIRNSTKELAILQGKTPEEAARLGDEQVLKMTVVPAQLDTATKENSLKEVLGAAPFKTQEGQLRVTSANAGFAKSQAQSELEAAALNAQMPGITNATVAAQQAATLGSQAAAEKAANEVLATSSLDPRAITDLARESNRAEVSKAAFVADNPAASAAANIPRGSGFESPAQTLKELREVQTLRPDGSVSGVLYGPSSAITNFPGLKVVPGKIRPIPGIKLDMQPIAP